jgi:hypothetical protein
MEVSMSCYTIKYYVDSTGTIIKLVIHNNTTKQIYVGIDDKISTYYDDIGVDIISCVEALLIDSAYILSDSIQHITVSFGFSPLVTFDIVCKLQKKRICCV